jgi:predicted aconitase with swiveling domain
MTQNKYLLVGLRILAIFGQTALLKLYTHYLKPDQLGKYFFYLTVSVSLNALLFVPIDYFQQAEVFRLERKGKSLAGLLKLNAKLLLTVGVIFAVILTACCFLKISFLGALCVIAALPVTLYASTAAKNFLNNRHDQMLVVGMFVAEIPVKFLVFEIMVRTGQVGPLTPLVATIASYVVVAAAVLPRLRSHISRFKGEEQPVNLWNTIRFSAPISFASIMNWLQLQGYRLVLVPLGYSEAVGLYATTAMIGNSGMNGAGTVYSQIYLPRIYQTEGKYLGTYVRQLLLLTAFVFCVSITLRSLIVRLVTNGRFLAYGALIGYGVLIEAGNFVIGALVIKLTIDHNTKAQIKANVAATITVPTLFFILYLVHRLTVFTIGIPLVAAQIVVVAILTYQSEIRLWKSHKASQEATPSLS